MAVQAKSLTAKERKERKRARIEREEARLPLAEKSVAAFVEAGEKMKLDSKTQKRIREHVEMMNKRRKELGITGGRPSLYRPEYARLVLEAMTKTVLHVPLAMVAELIGVPRATLDTWRVSEPEFAEAIAQGVAWQEYLLSNRLIEDHINTQGLIMVMKNSIHRYTDRQEIAVEHSLSDSVKEVEATRRPVEWQDVGSYGVMQASVPTLPSGRNHVPVQEDTPTTPPSTLPSTPPASPSTPPPPAQADAQADDTPPPAHT